MRIDSMPRTALILVVLVPLVALADHEFLKDEGFDYSKNGSDWGGLCHKGEKQSPVHILLSSVQDGAQLPFPLDTQYVAAQGLLFNDGHSAQVTGPFGGFTFGTNTYKFQNLHFHRYSEHTTAIHNGQVQRYPLEMHLEHKSEAGDIAVIAVLFDFGAPNPFFAQFENLLPEIAGTKDVKVPLENFQLPKLDGAYYHYRGSLTTPPCTEGVIYNVMTTPMSISLPQLSKYSKAFRTLNARNTQPLNGRAVYRSRTEATSAASNLLDLVESPVDASPLSFVA